MISAGTFFQANNIYHGDMRPANIMMNNDGKLTISDHGLLNPYKDNFNKALAGKKDVYLTPVLLEHLKNKNKNPSYDVNKSDVFSLGMTLVHAANLESPLSSYDWSKKYISKAELDSHLQKIQNNYSPRFTQLVKAMTELDENQRPDFLQLASLTGSMGPGVPSQFPGNHPSQLLNNSTLQQSQAFNPYKSALSNRSVAQPGNPFLSKVGTF